jgi:hypothetical protein
MLFKKQVLEGIREGTITLAFRRWKRPTVREGGKLMTPVGQLTIGAVTTTDLWHITAEEARRAGYDSLDELETELMVRETGEIYRIELGPLHPDPRITLRDSLPTEKELEDLHLKLKSLDKRSGSGSWTYQVLLVIHTNPRVRAGDLCGEVKQEKEQFKKNVRKLKNLGLTESLEVGYRLSRRGRAFLEFMQTL